MVHADRFLATICSCDAPLPTLSPSTSPTTPPTYIHSVTTIRFTQNGGMGVNGIVPSCNDDGGWMRFTTIKPYIDGVYTPFDSVDGSNQHSSFPASNANIDNTAFSNCNGGCYIEGTFDTAVTLSKLEIKLN